MPVSVSDAKAKPGALSRKPELQPLPSSPGSSVDRGKLEKKGMSISSAKERTGGGSQKERMAIVQSKGGLSAPPPLSPKPAQKLQRKPLPVASPASVDDKETGPSSFSTRNSTDQVPQEACDEEPSATVKNRNDAEKEGQSRAAIVAPMARLSGTKVSMMPRVFGKERPIKRTEIQKQGAQTPKEKTNKSLGAVGPDVGGQSEYVLTKFVLQFSHLPRFVINTIIPPNL